MTGTIDTLFGAHAGPSRFPNANPTETPEECYARVTAAFGVTNLPVRRRFSMGDFIVPQPGVPTITSFDQNVEQVIAGELDDEFTAWTGVVDPNVHNWACLNHECDNPSKKIDPTRQVLAASRMNDVIHANRQNAKLKTASILMGSTIRTGNWHQWVTPGLDAFGADCYWRTWLPKTPQAVYDTAIAAAASLGQRLLICETSLETGFTDAEWSMFTQQSIDYLNGTARAVCWFESNKVDGDWRLEVNHPTALGKFSTAVQGSVHLI